MEKTERRKRRRMEKPLAGVGRRANASIAPHRRTSWRAGIWFAGSAENAQTVGASHFRSCATVARKFGEVPGKISTGSKSTPGPGQTSVTRYEHKQIGHVIIWSLL